MKGDLVDGSGKIQVYAWDYYTMSVIDPSAPWFQKRELSQTQYPSWRLVYAETRDPAVVDDPNVYITVADEQGYKLDASGKPVLDPSGKWYVPIHPLDGITVMLHNGGETPLKTNKNPDGNHHGEVDFNQTADSSFDPSKNQIGPYSVDIFDGKLPSETAYGMGLPMRRHRSYVLGFQKVLSAGPTPPPEPPPPPPPGKTRMETALAALKASGGSPVPLTFNAETYYAAGNMDTGIIVRRPRDGAVWMMWPEEL